MGRSGDSQGDGVSASVARGSLTYVLGVGLGYLLLAELSLLSQVQNLGVALFWLGSGWSMGALYISRRRAWPALLASVGVAAMVSNALHGIEPARNLGFALANVVEPLCGAQLARLITRRWGRDIHSRVLLPLLAGASSCVVGASIGTLTLALAGFDATARTFTLWFACDLLGVLLVVPPFVAFSRSGPIKWQAFSKAQWLEASVYLAALVFAGFIEFNATDVQAASLEATVAYVPLIVLLLVALRLGVRATVPAVIVLALVAVGMTFSAHGPFANASVDVLTRATALQIYLAVVVVMGLVPAALLESHRATHRETLARESRLRSILESLGDAIITVDGDGRVTRVNAGALRLFGTTQADCEGASLGTLVEAVGGSSELLLATIAEARRDNMGVNASEDIRLLDGGDADESGRVLQLHVAPIKGEDGLVVVMTDVSERHQQEADLHAVREQLYQAQKLEAVGQLAGGVAHDFNNLLTVMLGSAELIGTELSGPNREFLNTIIEAGDRAQGLTRQLLSFSRRQPLEKKAASLNGLVDEVGAMLARLIPENIVIDVIKTDEPTVALVDRGQVGQVLLNLVVNARDAMPSGGNVRITTRVTVPPEGVSQRYGLQPVPYVLLSVADTGTGMDATTAARIFEPFFTTKAVGHGTGLGLATVHGIVERHGGGIDVQSALGVGTTFDVYLPLHASTAEATQARQTVDPTASLSLRLLCVEDEPAVRRLVEAQLRQLGHEPTMASSAEEALVLFDAAAHSLVLSDVIMPGMSGKELIDQLQSAVPGLAVVLMTGYSGGILQDVAGSHPFPILRKPFSMAQLQAALMEALEKQVQSESRPPARAANE